MNEQAGSLHLGNLINPKENTYFYVMLVISIIVWALAVISIFGLIIVAGLGIVAWFAHGLLVARLRSESVRITSEQYPELHATFVEVCQSLGLARVPDLYILQSGGILNAFATRHAGRDFVVLYSSFVETLGASSAMMKFLMGHEVGHIQRKHLSKKMYLAPGVCIPLISEAYHRACEATCDRYGAYAAQDLNAAVMALTVLASGREAVNTDARQFADQHFKTRGFFVSWHELIISYPTLSQRVAHIFGFQDQQYTRPTSRNILAYPFAFVFSFRTLIVLYLGVVMVSVLISLGQQVKKREQARETSEQQQPPQQQDVPQIPSVPAPTPQPGQ